MMILYLPWFVRAAKFPFVSFVWPSFHSFMISFVEIVDEFDYEPDYEDEATSSSTGAFHFTFVPFYVNSSHPCGKRIILENVRKKAFLFLGVLS